MRRSYFVCGALLLLPIYGRAQDTLRREIGLRTSPSDLSQVGFIYKKQLTENTYRRYRLVSGNLGLATTGNEDAQFNFGIGAAIGRETRRRFDDRLQFVYGPELLGSLFIVSAGGGTTTFTPSNGSTVTVRGSGTVLAPSIGLGYVLGVQYSFNPRWYVSAEIIPTASLYGVFGRGIFGFGGFRAGFDSSSVGITGAYAF